MCGFIGVVHDPNASPVDAGLLARMNATLRHRGPDGQGVYCSGPVSLGHCRLRVIDTSEAADQPMFNEDRTVVVVFNGEIYNFMDLRTRLETTGHRFATHTDTEVLVHGWEEWGEDLPTRLDGMFAFAVYDMPKERIFIPRDRFGKKPLYYGMAGRTFLFGSELKAIMAHPDFSRTMDPLSIHQYFAHDYVPTPRTIFRDARKMPAASQMTINIRSPHIWPEPKTYWHLSFTPKRVISFREAVGEADRLFRAAVQRRLVSDVPLGVLLSGGLDSSAVLAEMRCLEPQAEIKTFSIGFEDSSYDERSHAQVIANHFRTDHHEHVVTSREALDHAQTIMQDMDEPFSDQSILPMSLLCRFVREHVTVALGGDGGDELLAGYDPFLAHGFLGSMGEAVRVFQPLIKALSQRIPVSESNMSAAFRIRHFLQGFPPGIGDAGQIRCALWMAPCPPEDQATLFLEPVPEPGELFHASAMALEGRNACHPVDRLSAWFLGVYMHDNILVKVDRASMLHSLEVRSPFLDTGFSEFVTSLPASMKLHGLTRKRLLRAMMKGRLPTSTLTRGKKGFGIPAAAWMRNEFFGALRGVSTPAILSRQGLFCAETVDKWIRQHKEGRADRRKALWAFLMFQMWCESHGLLA